MHTTSDADVVQLRSGPLRLALRPDLGGCIAGFWRNELQVLRSAEPQDVQGPRASGCFPLVPYSNRLGFRHFRFAGRDHAVRPNVDDSPHTLHGVGWRRAWRTQALQGDRAVLVLDHTADEDWPFAFRAAQTFELDDAGLRVSMSITNLDAHPAPVGLGWHPYFPKRSRSRLHAEISDRWEADPVSQLPTRRVPQPGIDADIVHLRFDHCFEGWQGVAHIRDEHLRLGLRSSLPYLVVYTPAEREHFCVEPVSHVSNALNMSEPAAHGVIVLGAGQVADAWMRLDVRPI